MRAASLVGLLLFLGSSMSSRAEPAPLLRLWTGGGISSDQFTVELRADGHLMVSHFARPRTPNGLTETKYALDLSREQLEELVSLAAASTDFADGCGLVADGTSAALSVDAKTRVPDRSCKNASQWPVGPRTKTFLSALNALLPDEFKVF